MEFPSSQPQCNFRVPASIVYLYWVFSFLSLIQCLYCIILYSPCLATLSVLCFVVRFSGSVLVCVSPPSPFCVPLSSSVLVRVSPPCPFCVPLSGSVLVHVSPPCPFCVPLSGSVLVRVSPRCPFCNSLFRLVCVPPLCPFSVPFPCSLWVAPPCKFVSLPGRKLKTILSQASKILLKFLTP